MEIKSVVSYFFFWFVFNNQGIQLITGFIRVFFFKAGKIPGAAVDKVVMFLIVVLYILGEEY